MKNLNIVLFAILSIAAANASDNIICSPSGSACQLIDASGNHWNAKIGFTTDGNGDIFTLGDVASTDNILGQNPSGNRTLIDNSSRRWSASVLYTTDGNGNVIPVPSGGGGDGVTAVTGTAPVVSSGGSTPAISMPAATNSVDGYLTSADHTTFAEKQSALTFSSPLMNSSGTVSANVFTGDSGSGGSTGIVPAPSAGQAESQFYLNASGSFTAPDQSKPRYSSFSMISQTSSPDPGAATKYENVIISGSHAYAIGGASAPGLTLSIFNIANQSAPVAEGYLTTGSVPWTSGASFLNGAYNATVGGGYLWVCSSGSSYLYSVNVSNPNNPVNFSGFLPPGTPGSLYDCAYNSGYVYIATQSAGLDVVDVGGGACGGTALTPVNCYQEGGGVKSFGVTVSGGTLYTTQYTTSVFTTRQIKSWSIATPQTPSLLQSLQVTTAGEALGISVYGNTAYVSVSATGVNAYDVIDVTTPSAMTNLSVITPSAKLNSAFAAIQDGNYAFLPSGTDATRGGAIDMYDMTNRSAPKYITTAWTNVANSVFGGIAADGHGYIYSADYGPNSGSTGTLDVFTEPTLSAAIGSGVADVLSIANLLTLPVQGSGVAPTGPANGSVAFNSSHILCVYNGSGWVQVSDGSTSCTF